MIPLLIQLTACGTITSSCIPIKEYTNNEQDSAANDLSKLPIDSEALKMFKDYHILRELNKVQCRGN
jgi:hypothetical protein